MLTSQQKYDIEAKVQEMVEKAEELYDIDFGFVDVTFNKRSMRTVATAQVKCRKIGRGRNKIIVEGSCTDPKIHFNAEAFIANWDDMVNDTIPHEVAHLVNYFKPSTGSGHDYGWKRVCKALGGTGERCTKQGEYKDLTPGRKVREFIYIASCGTKVVMKTGRHNKIQNGYMYQVKRTGGKITKSGYQQEKVA